MNFTIFSVLYLQFHIILSIFNWVAIGITFTAGAKLQSVCTELALAIYKHFDSDGDGTIDWEELKIIQNSDNDHLEGVEPSFWFNNPHLLLIMIQWAMWQNSQTISIALYYTIRIGQDSCYMQQRSLPMLIVQVRVVCVRVCCVCMCFQVQSIGD